LAEPSLKGFNSAVPISVDCVFIHIIGHINITHNTFDVKFDIDLTWDATEEDLKNYENNPRDYVPTFVPNLVYSNSMTVAEKEIVPLRGGIRYQIRNDKNYIRQRFIGTMVNDFEVETFPFDIQNLVLTVALSFYPSDQAYFHPRLDGKPFIYVPTKFTAVPGFELVRTFGDVITDKSNFSNLVVVVQVRRLRGPYLFRILMPLFFLNAATFSIYLVEYPAEKINILIASLFSFVGMIYVLSSMVPMAGKSNIFDRYAMASVALCAMNILAIGNFEKISLEGVTEGNAAAYLHVTLASILHAYVIVSMSMNILDAMKKTKCSLEEATRFIWRDDLTNS